MQNTMIETPGAKIRENFGKSNRPTVPLTLKLLILSSLSLYCSSLSSAWARSSFWAHRNSDTILPTFAETSLAWKFCLLKRIFFYLSAAVCKKKPKKGSHQLSVSKLCKNNHLFYSQSNAELDTCGFLLHNLRKILFLSIFINHFFWLF